ncbi:hypothetical protein OG883_31115 [Streptomyces sp. NBC_01142]|uniref:hypothetical protein n=1 Tax=Streptomyces sp. NBC_01142 TaxID=2975865 RepID=UPI00224DE1A1|nr:hypothetical protein [Streptomyces sp. NBC_01142]MCX4824230.1 hypothetical protein [Streptomyces sp. NBC_01142]
MSAVTIPGALADYLSNQFISDDETAAALDAARRGRGRTLVIEPTSPRVLHVISRFAEHLLKYPSIRTRAQRDAARLWIKRAGHAPARMTHQFDNTREAYNHTQCRDDIRDGDVLVVRSERVVGILVKAWPAAITEAHGELHTLTAPAREIEGGAYAEAAETAEQAAHSYGFPLAVHTPVNYPVGARVREGNRLGTVTAVNVETFHLSTLTTTHDNVTITWDHGTESTIHPSHVEPAEEPAEDIEAQQAAAEVTETEAVAGTWRGEWIGEQQAGDALFTIEPAAEQGALFTEGDQPTREAVTVRMTPDPAGLARIRAKAAADRKTYRATMDERQAADHIAHGAPVPAAVQARIDARRATEAAPEQGEQLPARRVIEGVIVGHAGTAEGSMPADAGHPNVIAARAALDGLAAARMTDHHDVSDPTEAEQDIRGYLVEPRGGARVAVYWLEGGRTIRRDTPIDGAALDCLAHTLTRRGWKVEKMLRSSQCVFAHRPTD